MPYLTLSIGIPPHIQSLALKLTRLRPTSA